MENGIVELDKKFCVEKKSQNSRTVKKCTPIKFSVTKCLLILFYSLWAVAYSAIGYTVKHVFIRYQQEVMYHFFHGIIVLL